LSEHNIVFVIPAKAGIQLSTGSIVAKLDSRLRGNDEFGSGILLTGMKSKDSHLLLLLNWMSPTFPIGSFAYSHGLEQAIVDGRVTAQKDVEGWIGDLLQSGSGWNDAVVFAGCWVGDVAVINEMALALAGSSGRYLETTQLGRNFNIAAAVWTDEELRDEVMAYPVAAGRACCAFGISQRDATSAFLQGFTAAMVSVAVRLVPLGQTSGLKVMRNLAPVISETAARACAASLDDLGSNCVASDIAAMKHEVLQPRIFRT
jgi:urease accessory protein